jgi:RNA polymerase sigma-70 factor, ECF subfamily
VNPTLEEIWNESAGQLRRFIQRRVSNPELAEDILQDVFVRISKRLERLEERAKIHGWLYLIARNAIIDHYRTRRETVELPETLAVEEDFAPGELEELKAAFRRMIHSLPGPYREAILLTEFEGLSQVELARQLGISVSGAKSRVQRGRQQLKEILLDRCHFEFDRRGRVFDCQPRRPGGCAECAAPPPNGAAFPVPALSS